MPQTKVASVIEEISDVLATVPGVSFAPLHPPDQLPAGQIFAVVHLSNGRGVLMGGGTWAQYVDDVAVYIGVPLSDMALADEIVLPVIRLATNSILRGYNDLTITPQGTPAINYEYGPFQWGGVWMFGATLTIEGVKTQVTL